jgi:hypothetical protein
MKFALATEVPGRLEGIWPTFLNNDAISRQYYPWIRTHERAGGVIAGTAEGAMVIEGPRETWEGWTRLGLPENGEAAVPGGLVPVVFERGHGVYREPCVWLRRSV